MNKFHKLICIILCLAAVFALPLTALADEEETTNYFDYYGSDLDKEDEREKDKNAFDAASEFSDPNGRLLVVSNKGDWRNFPENSLEAVLSAFEKGADIVKVNVKQLKDGNFVLMADDTTGRTCYGGDDKPLKELTAEEIKKYRLLSGVGEKMSRQTNFEVPFLYDVLGAVQGKGMLMLDFDWALRDVLYNVVKDRDMLGDVIFYTEAKAKDIGEWASGLEVKPHIMSGYKSNIVFMIGSYIKKSFEGGAEAVRLATKNPYGVIFDNFTMKKFESVGRAAIDLTDPNLCGSREDTEKWWNDVVSRGYSIIITDYPEELSEYAKETEYAKTQLREAYKRYKEQWVLPEFKSYTFGDYKRAYLWAVSDAEEYLSGRVRSKYDYLTARAALERAAVNIEKNFTALQEGVAGLTITPPRILVAALSIIAVVSVQIYFHKKKKTEEKSVKC